VSRAIGVLPGGAGTALDRRVGLLLEHLDGAGRPPGDDKLTRLAALLDRADRSVTWLVLAVLRASLPVTEDVVGLLRDVRTTSGAAALAELVARRDVVGSLMSGTPVEVTSATLVDVHATVSDRRATGIQRVTRETVRHWMGRRPVRCVAWHDGLRALRDLSPAETEAVAAGLPAPRTAEGLPADPPPASVLVPWRGGYLLPELALDPPRTARVRALAAWSGCRTGAVGFDCVPVTTAETTDAGISEYFAHNLAAMRDVDVVATISDAAATEYRGWTRMLSSIGRRGPAIVPVPLPQWAPEPEPAVEAAARARFAGDGSPLVLCVGSHEPRKNHLAVLHAAHRAWSAGRRFTLAFVGARGWRGDEFAVEAARLADLGFPVVHHEGVSDPELWAAYRTARFLVFPSLNEGYGLPVAEALALGTPVLTSAHGSLGDLAMEGGTVTVDPRDDDDVLRGMLQLLDDDVLLAELRDQARRRPVRTWADYADDLWGVLVPAAPDTVGGSTP
jgi:glycosyltransferase involved in cell wall biosynthesis